MNVFRWLTIVVIVCCFSSPALAERQVIVDERPTKITGSGWYQDVTSNAGSYDANLWVNIWPSDGKLGGYVYTQVAEGYTQLYGGLAGRSGHIEAGTGVGFENSGGQIDLRTSLYAVVTSGRLCSATWFEQSKAGGVWFLSHNLYAVRPNRLEAGLRLQRHLGAGPMGRLTLPSVSRFQLQASAAVLYDGDQVNPILGVNLNF